MSKISELIEEVYGQTSYDGMWSANKLVKFMDRGSASKTRSGAMKIAARIARQENKKTYFILLLEKIESIGNPVDMNRILEQLIAADNDKMFSSIFTATVTANRIIPIEDAIPPDSVAEDKTLIDKVVNTYVNLKKQLKILDGKELLKEIGKFVGGGAQFMAFNTILQGTGYLPHTFGCMLWGYPLPHIQEIEIARSGKILKFRATGSVFLANQKGGLDAIVIECLILPDELVFTLMSLWILFLFGKGDVRGLDNIPKPTEINPSDLRAKISEVTSYDPTIAKPSYEYHRTFPFVSRHVIIPNVYIETISFEDRVVDGRNVVKASILCRTYRKPKVFTNYATSDKTSNFFGANPNTSTMMYSMLDWMMNAAWRYINSTGVVLDERSWKTGVDVAGQDDVYYNIDPLDVAQSFTFGVWGITV